ncbi:hypothetical protein K469DRAFT_792015 [Zopfia rhizophila CBS 207.26]|uniref:N-acetyltransferase domain-containing protein n=1 Tax=Zopfia rhizophila CBS 207.26 TaxID=1314779 RepID=A0A6A6DRI0_9PEZI|nr:hypothetical protein K469DRAFT_792015 [Zopfia rhizophila CBS 207.26]
MNLARVHVELEDRTGRQHTIRQATPTDLPRLAFVLMVAFSFSPVNQFQRPRYQAYPGDTFYDYYLQLVESFLNPTTWIYVSEDSYAPAEESIPEAFPKEYFCPGTGDKVIAGSYNFIPVALTITAEYLTLLKDSTRSRGRDKDQEAVKSYVKQTETAKKVRFQGGSMSIETLVVHPCYWRRGHGTALAEVCARLADKRSANACVSATKMSKGILEGFGFEFQDLEVKCEHPFPIYLGVRLSRTN